MAEQYPAQVDREAVGAGGRERLFEQRAGHIIRRGDCLRCGGEQGQPRGQGSDAGVAGGGHVGGCLRAPAGADGRLHQVHDYPQGERDVGGKHARWADLGGMQVSVVKIALSQRRKCPPVLSMRLGHVGSAWCGPAGYLVSQYLCRAGATACRREDRLPVLEYPRHQPVASRIDELKPLVCQPLSFVPPASHQVIEAQVPRTAPVGHDGSWIGPTGGSASCPARKGVRDV